VPSVSRYEHDGILFDPPDGWIDFATVTLQKPLPLSSREVCTLSVSREPLALGETLRARTQKKLIAVSNLPSFEYAATTEHVLGGKPSIVLRYRWANDYGRILQSLVAVEIVRASGAHMAILVSTTSSEADHEAHERAFDEILASIAFPSNGATPP
jgi:hypothetical protein